VAEQEQLLLLKGKLRKIRRDKRNIMILGGAIFFPISLIVLASQNWNEVSTANLVYLLIVFIIVVIVRLTVFRRYDAMEAQVIEQIRQLVKSNAENKAK
jgi:uncharacterized membrane protein